MSDHGTGKALVASFIEVVWRRGELDRLPDFWTADCVNHADAAGDNSGLAALRRYHEGFATAFSGLDDWRIAIAQQVAEGDRVATELVTTVRHVGPFSGAPATGRTVTLHSMRIDRLRGDRIAEHWSVADLAGLMRQLAA